MKKIFITGAGGYIGGNLATFLSRKKYQIYCLTTKKKNKLSNTKWIVGKLNGNYHKYLKQCDLLIHCAAAGVHKRESKKLLNKVNNLDSLKFLKNAYKANCKNWIILGSSFEYGYSKNKPFSSTKTKLKPIDNYGKSKVKFFKNLKKLKFLNDCKILYLRVFQVYGGNESKLRMYPSLLDAAKKNKNFKMTQGQEIRDFIHIKETMKKIYSSIKIFKKNNFFMIKNLATGKGLKVKNFALRLWKEKKAKKRILFGALKKNSGYQAMYSDTKSLL